MSFCVSQVAVADHDGVITCFGMKKGEAVVGIESYIFNNIEILAWVPVFFWSLLINHCWLNQSQTGTKASRIQPLSWTSYEYLLPLCPGTRHLA